MTIYNQKLLGQDRADSTIFNTIYSFMDESDSIAYSNAVFIRQNINDITSDTTHINLGKDINVSQIHAKTNDINIFIETGFNPYVNYAAERYLYTQDNQSHSIDVMNPYFSFGSDSSFQNPILFKFDLTSILEKFSSNPDFSTIIEKSANSLVKLIFNIRTPITIDSTNPDINELYQQYINESSIYFKNKNDSIKSSLSLNYYLYSILNDNKRTSLLFIDFTIDGDMVDCYYYKILPTNDKLKISIYKSHLPWVYYHRKYDQVDSVATIYSNQSATQKFDFIQTSYSLDIGQQCGNVLGSDPNSHLGNITKTDDVVSDQFNTIYKNINYVYSRCNFKWLIKTNKLAEYDIDLSSIVDLSNWTGTIEIKDPSLHKLLNEAKFRSLYNLLLIDSNKKLINIPIDITTDFDSASISINTVLNNNECVLHGLNFVNCKFDDNTQYIYQQPYAITDALSLQSYDATDNVIEYDLSSIAINNNEDNVFNLSIDSTSKIYKNSFFYNPAPVEIVDRELLGINDPQNMTMFNIVTPILNKNIPWKPDTNGYLNRRYTPFGLLEGYGGWLISNCQADQTGSGGGGTYGYNMYTWNTSWSSWARGSPSGEIGNVMWLTRTGADLFTPTIRTNISSYLVVPEYRTLRFNSYSSERNWGFWNSIFNWLYSIDFTYSGGQAVFNVFYQLDSSYKYTGMKAYILPFTYKVVGSSNIYSSQYTVADETSLTGYCNVNGYDNYYKCWFNKEKLWTNKLVQTTSQLTFQLTDHYSNPSGTYNKRSLYVPVDETNDTTINAYDDFGNVYEYDSSLLQRMKHLNEFNGTSDQFAYRPDQTTYYYFLSTSQMLRIVNGISDIIKLNTQYPFYRSSGKLFYFTVIQDSSIIFGHDNYNSYRLYRYGITYSPYLNWGYNTFNNNTRLINVYDSSTILYTEKSNKWFKIYEVNGAFDTQLTVQHNDIGYWFIVNRTDDGYYWFLGSNVNDQSDPQLYKYSYDGTSWTKEHQQDVDGYIVYSSSSNDFQSSSSFMNRIDSSTQQCYQGFLTTYKSYVFYMIAPEDSSIATVYVDSNKNQSSYPLITTDDNDYKISRAGFSLKESGGMIGDQYVVWIGGSPFTIAGFDFTSNEARFAKMQDENILEYIVPGTTDLRAATGGNLQYLLAFCQFNYPLTKYDSSMQYMYSSNMIFMQTPLKITGVNSRDYMTKSIYMGTISSPNSVTFNNLGQEAGLKVIFPAYEVNDSYLLGSTYIPQRSLWMKNYYNDLASVQNVKVVNNDRIITTAAITQSQNISEYIYYINYGFISRYNIANHETEQVNIVPQKVTTTTFYNTSDKNITGIITSAMYGGSTWYQKMVRYSKERNRYYELPVFKRNRYTTTGRASGSFDYCDNRQNITEKGLMGDTYDVFPLNNLFLMNTHLNYHEYSFVDDMSNVINSSSAPQSKIISNSKFYSNVLTSDICPETFDEYLSCVHTCLDNTYWNLGYGLSQIKDQYDKIDVHHTTIVDYSNNQSLIRNVNINDEPSFNYYCHKFQTHTAHTSGYAFGDKQNLLNLTTQIKGTPDFTPVSFNKIDSTTLEMIGTYTTDWTCGLSVFAKDRRFCTDFSLYEQMDNTTDYTFSTIRRSFDITTNVISTFGAAINFADLTAKSLKHLCDYYIYVAVTDSTGNTGNIYFNNPYNSFIHFKDNKYHWLAYNSFYKHDSSIDIQTVLPELNKITKVRAKYQKDATVTLELYDSANNLYYYPISNQLQGKFLSLDHTASTDVIDVSTDLFYFIPLSVDYNQSIMQLYNDASNELISLSLTSGNIINQYSNKKVVYKKNYDNTSFIITYRDLLDSTNQLTYTSILSGDGTLSNSNCIDVLSEHVLLNKSTDTTGIVITGIDSYIDVTYNSIELNNVYLGYKTTFLNKQWIYDGAAIVYIGISVQDMKHHSSKNLVICIPKNNQFYNVLNWESNYAYDQTNVRNKNNIIKEILNTSIGEYSEVVDYPFDCSRHVQYYDKENRSLNVLDSTNGFIYKLNNISVYNGKFFYRNNDSMSFDNTEKQIGEYAFYDSMHAMMQYHDVLPSIYFTPQRRDGWGYPFVYYYDQSNLIFAYNAPVGVTKVKFNFDVVAMINYNSDLFDYVKTYYDSGWVTEKLTDFSGYFPVSNVVMQRNTRLATYNRSVSQVKFHTNFTLPDFTSFFPDATDSFFNYDTSNVLLNPFSALRIYFGNKQSLVKLQTETDYYTDQTNDSTYFTNQLIQVPTYRRDMSVVDSSYQVDNTLFAMSYIDVPLNGESILQQYVAVLDNEEMMDLHNIYFDSGAWYYHARGLNDNSAFYYMRYITPTQWKQQYSKIVGSLYVTYNNKVYSIIDNSLKDKGSDATCDQTFISFNRLMKKFDFINIHKPSWVDSTSNIIPRNSNYYYYSDNTQVFEEDRRFRFAYYPVITESPAHTFKMNAQWVGTYVNGATPTITETYRRRGGVDTSLSNLVQHTGVILSPGDSITGLFDVGLISIGTRGVQFQWDSDGANRPAVGVSVSYPDVFGSSTLNGTNRVYYYDNIRTIVLDRGCISYKKVYLTVSLSSSYSSDVTFFNFIMPINFSPNDYLTSQFSDIPINVGYKYTSYLDDQTNSTYFLAYNQYGQIRKIQNSIHIYDLAMHKSKLVWNPEAEADDTVHKYDYIKDTEESEMLFMAKSDASIDLLFRPDSTGEVPTILSEGTNSWDQTAYDVSTYQANLVGLKIKLIPESTRSSPCFSPGTNKYKLYFKYNKV